VGAFFGKIMTKGLLKLSFCVIFSVLVCHTGTVRAENYNAHDFDLNAGKKLYQTKANCLTCHGWDGNGTGMHPRSVGKAPNLREFIKDAEILREIVACGRPGSMMPYHDRMAYRDDRCYGLVMADFGEDEVKPKRGKTIRPEEIDNLVAYVMEFIIGRQAATLDDCEKFFKQGHPNCNIPSLK